ncbi:hypothetical protein Mapa_006638 [Marchantia paleacea]|nr:hypothetical protein Mapa_006638 [Marchantia paleacea]
MMLTDQGEFFSQRSCDARRNLLLLTRTSQKLNPVHTDLYSAVQRETCFSRSWLLNLYTELSPVVVGQG